MRYSVGQYRLFIANIGWGDKLDMANICNSPTVKSACVGFELWTSISKTFKSYIFSLKKLQMLKGRASCKAVHSCCCD